MTKSIGAYHAIQNNLYIYSETSNLPFSSSGISGRGSIDRLSTSAGARMRKYLRTCVADYSVFITLTYPSGFGGAGTGQQCKEHLRRFMQEYRRHAERSGASMDRFSAFWFMEFQEREVIHYHIFGTQFIGKNALSHLWYRIVGSEDPRHLASGTNVQSINSGKAGQISYASKYAAKQSQKTLPEEFGWAGRFWGVTGLRHTVSAAIYVERGLGENPSIKRKVEKIKGLLKTGLETGKIKKLKGKQGDEYRKGSVFVINDSKLRHDIEIAVFLLQGAVMAVKGPSIFWPDAVNVERET